jgi:hypothetical protein
MAVRLRCDRSFDHRSQVAPPLLCPRGQHHPDLRCSPGYSFYVSALPPPLYLQPARAALARRRHIQDGGRALRYLV